MEELNLIFEPKTLEGLGAVEKERVAKAVKEVSNQRLSREQLFLVSKASTLSQETKKRILDGSVRFAEAAYYVRVGVDNGSNGSTELFTDALDKVVGYTNISKGRLPELVNMALGRVEIRYAEAAATAKPNEVNYAPLNLATGPVALINGEMELIVDNKAVFRLPVNRFVESFRGTNEGQKDGLNLSNPYLIPETKDIQIRFYYAGNMPNNADKKHFIEVCLRGAETRSR